MSGPDQRSVGEVLLEAEQVARDLLHEAPSLDGRAMVRTWGEVLDAAAELWDALPPGAPTPGQDRGRAVDIMDQLGQGAASLHRRDRLATPSSAYDEGLLTVSEAFARAAQLVEKYPPTGQQNGAQREDVNAARARVVHTLYVAAHGVNVALAANLAEHQQLRGGRGVTAQGYPMAMLGDAYRRMSAVEQLAGSYVAHTYPQVLTGQHRDPVHQERLAEPFSSWDVQAHRALAGTPDSHTLRVVAAEQAWLVGASSMLWRAVTDTGHADPAQYRTRLAPVLDRAWEQWGHTAQTWRGLAPRQVQHPPPPALTAAGRELRAAVRELLHDPAGPATPQTVAARVDPGDVAAALQQSLATSVNLAHAFRDATAHPDLLASAGGANTALATREDTTLGPDRLEAVVDPHTLHTNRNIPLPEQLRARVQADGDALIQTSTVALGSSAGITGHHVTPQSRTPVHTTPTRPSTSVENMVMPPDRHLHSMGPRR